MVSRSCGHSAKSAPVHHHIARCEGRRQRVNHLLQQLSRLELRVRVQDMSWFHVHLWWRARQGLGHVIFDVAELEIGKGELRWSEMSNECSNLPL